jgi:hypothetical protein
MAIPGPPHEARWIPVFSSYTVLTGLGIATGRGMKRQLQSQLAPIPQNGIIDTAALEEVIVWKTRT